MCFLECIVKGVMVTRVTIVAEHMFRVMKIIVSQINYFWLYEPQEMLLYFIHPLKTIWTLLSSSIVRKKWQQHIGKKMV